MSDGTDGAAPDGSDRDWRRGALLVGALAALAAGLRFSGLGSDLWLDEIAPLRRYGGLSPLEVFGDFSRPNNHPLNTLLVNLAASLLGEREWAVRLPAALFGTATVPALYGLGRAALSRPAAGAAAGLLALSVHHVFFSQSARGYAAYLFFALLATRLLLDGLRRPGAGNAALYAGAMTLGFAAHPLTAFVLAGHVLVALAAARGLRRRAPGGSGWLAVALGGAAGLAALLYAPGAGQLLSGVRRSYLVDRIGFSPLSAEFARELSRGLAAGAGAAAILAALAAAPLLLAGATALTRRRWELPAALALPPLLTGLGLGLAGATVYPRFFLLGLPLAALAAAAGLGPLARVLSGPRARRREPGPAPHGELRLEGRLAIGLVLLAAAASLPPLAHYYRTPKQSYRAALRYLAGELEAGTRVVAADIAVAGVRYYAPKVAPDLGPRLVLARDDAAVEAALRGGGRHVIVTTFQRTLARRSPELAARLERDWRPDRVFPATVGDGEIRVWRRAGEE